MKKKFYSNKENRARQKYCPNCGINISGTHLFSDDWGKLIFTCIGILDKGDNDG